MKSKIEKNYGGWRPGYVEPEITAEPPQTEERRVEVSYSGRTLPLVWIGYKGDAFDPTNKMIASAYLLADLAFGENSDIYKKLVIREQKVQWIAGNFGFNRDPKLYDVYTKVKDPNDIEYVIGEIDATVEKFKTELVSADELENIKMRTRYGYLMRLDTPGNVASALARQTGCIECDLVIDVPTLRPGENATCPRCGHLITTC